MSPGGPRRGGPPRRHRRVGVVRGPPAVRRLACVTGIESRALRSGAGMKGAGGVAVRLSRAAHAGSTVAERRSRPGGVGAAVPSSRTGRVRGAGGVGCSSAVVVGAAAPRMGGHRLVAWATRPCRRVVPRITHPVTRHDGLAGHASNPVKKGFGPGKRKGWLTEAGVQAEGTCEIRDVVEGVGLTGQKPRTWTRRWRASPPAPPAFAGTDSRRHRVYRPPCTGFGSGLRRRTRVQWDRHDASRSRARST